MHAALCSCSVVSPQPASIKPVGRHWFDLEQRTLRQAAGATALVVFNPQPPSERLLSELLSAQAALKDDIAFLQVDCARHEDVCAAFQVRRPFIGWFRSGALRGEYGGARTAEAFAEFVESDPCHRSGWRCADDEVSAMPRPESSTQLRAAALLAVWLLTVIALTLVCEPDRAAKYRAIEPG